MSKTKHLQSKTNYDAKHMLVDTANQLSIIQLSLVAPPKNERHHQYARDAQRYKQALIDLGATIEPNNEKLLLEKAKEVASVLLATRQFLTKIKL